MISRLKVGHQRIPYQIASASSDFGAHCCSIRRIEALRRPPMVSMAFSSVFPVPLHSSAQGNPRLSAKSAHMEFLDLWSGASLGSAKSTCFRGQYRFSGLPQHMTAITSKPRRFATVEARAATEKSIYDFTVKDIDGKDVALSKFKDRVLLIVNVASRCGLTSSNYKELSHLYQKYKPQGFEILAFPCNQFGGQEPGSNPEIKEFACTRYKAEFPIFDKVDVNGPNTVPVYQFLKSNAGGFLGDVIKWNFEKFLVDKNGKIVERYAPTTTPFQIEKDIKKLLAA